MFVNVQFPPRHFGTWQTFQVAVSFSGKHLLDTQRLSFWILQPQFLSSATGSSSFSLTCRTLTLGSYVFTSSLVCFPPCPWSSVLDNILHWLLLPRGGGGQGASGNSTTPPSAPPLSFLPSGPQRHPPICVFCRHLWGTNPPWVPGPGAHTPSSSLVLDLSWLEAPSPTFPVKGRGQKCTAPSDPTKELSQPISSPADPHRHYPPLPSRQVVSQTPPTSVLPLLLQILHSWSSLLL